MSNIRRFSVPEGRTVVLPVALAPGPGQTSQRLRAGAEIDLEVGRATAYTRFLNLALRNGDLVELDANAPPNPDAIKAEILPKPGAHPQVAIATGAPVGKE